MGFEVLPRVDSQMPWFRSGANLSRDLRPSWVFRLGQLPPIPLEALPMPTDDGSGLND